MQTILFTTNNQSSVEPEKVTTTLQRLRALERLYQQGYHDDVVDRAVSKLVEHQIHKDETQLRELTNALMKFEEQFGMSSQDFEKKYQAGEAGDDIDVFEWHVFIQMYLRLQQQLQILKNPSFLAEQ
jgi:hypothetical protein